MDYQNEADAKEALSDPSLPPGELAVIAHRHPALWGEIAKHPSVYPGLLKWMAKYGKAKPPTMTTTAPTALPGSAPGAGILIQLAGIVELMVGFSATYSSWTFGTLPGVVSGLPSSNAAGNGASLVSALVVGLVWIGIGFAVSYKMYLRPVIVTGISLAAVFLLLQVPSFEYMALPAQFMQWSFIVVLQTIIMPLCLTIAMVLSLLVARSRQNRAMALWAMGFLGLAAVISLSFGIWWSALTGDAKRLFYVAPAILFAIGWIVADNRLDARPIVPPAQYAPASHPTIAPARLATAAPIMAMMPPNYQDRLALADINTSAEMLYDIAMRDESLWPQIVAHPNAYQEMLDWMDAEGNDAVKEAIAKVRAMVPDEATIPGGTTDSDTADSDTAEGGPAFASMEASINSWPNRYSDTVGGKDIIKWRDEALELFGPTMLFGQESNGIVMPPLVSTDEIIKGSWPCFFDDSPLKTQTPYGQKAKFHGVCQAGLMVVTGEHVVMAHNMKGPLLMAYAVPRERVLSVNKLEFRFSPFSMSSAGDGYEVLFADGDGTMGRWLFRTAVNVTGLNIRALVMPPAGS